MLHLLRAQGGSFCRQGLCAVSSPRSFWVLSPPTREKQRFHKLEVEVRWRRWGGGVCGSKKRDKLKPAPAFPPVVCPRRLYRGGRRVVCTPAVQKCIVLGLEQGGRRRRVLEEHSCTAHTSRLLSLTGGQREGSETSALPLPPPSPSVLLLCPGGSLLPKL